MDQQKIRYIASLSEKRNRETILREARAYLVGKGWKKLDVEQSADKDADTIFKCMFLQCLTLEKD